MPPRQNTARRRQAEPESTQALFAFMDGLVPPPAPAAPPAAAAAPAAPLAPPAVLAAAPPAWGDAPGDDAPAWGDGSGDDGAPAWEPDLASEDPGAARGWGDDGGEACPSFDEVPPAWLDEAPPPSDDEDRYRAPAWLDEAPPPADDGRAGALAPEGWGWDIDPREIPYGAAPAGSGWDADAPVPPAIRQAVDDVLAGLNPQQREAATTTEGPLLVVAGAGTGKTRVLTTRIAHLIASRLARASEILAVTFTNKAAKEMRERIEALIGDEARMLRMGSFHSMSMAILRRHPVSAGLRDRNFTIVDEDDQEKLVERAMLAIGLTDTESQGKGRSKLWKDRIAEIHKRIQDWKEDGQTVADLRARGVSAELDIVLAVYDTYQKDLLARNACDFADLLLHVVVLFRQQPEIRALWASRYRYVLVDEFQDTNKLQYEWLTHLAHAHHNLCAVGDLDQCIYEWRGANPSIFMGFKDDWTPCKVVTVDQNYRSTAEILEIANRVVATNPRPVPKSLRSDVRGDAPRLDVYESHTDEAQGIAQQIAKRIALGQSPNEMAILVRTSRPMLQFEQALTRCGLNYAVVGGMKFHEREEIKDALCYLRIALDPRDEFAFRRIANKPTRDVGGATLDKVVAAQLTGKAADFAEACLWAADNAPRIPAKAKEGLRDLARIIGEANAKAREGLRPGQTIAWLLERVAYFEWRKKLEDENLHEREENVAELIQDADEYSDPSVYLQNMATLGQADAAEEAAGQVRISTIHAAKGLEFRTVWTPALEEEILPNARAMRDRQNGLAEERRICHVAWTRAKRELIVSYAEQRHFQLTLPSRFLSDVGLIHKAAPGGAPRPAAAQPPTPRPAFNAAAGAAGGYTFRRFTPPRG